MTPETKLMLICLILLGLGLVYSVFKVAGAWHEHHITRHDLIAESKRRRVEYFRALAERDAELMAIEEESNRSVIIEEAEAILDNAAEEPLANAA